MDAVPSMLEYIVRGAASAVLPMNLLVMFIGLVVGIVGGMLPGITTVTAVALFVPFTFSMPPDMALIGLGGVFCGAMYGGANAAILINTPGTPGSIATSLDGYPLVMQGRAEEACYIALIASVLGGIFGTVVLMLFFEPLSVMALKFGSEAFFWMGLFGLSTLAAMFPGNIAKGLLGGAIGLALCTVGLDPVMGMPRFTFGCFDLVQGLDMVALMIGLFSLSQMFVMLESDEKYIVKMERQAHAFKLAVTDILRHLKLLSVASAIGHLHRRAPRCGGSVAALVSYNEAKRWDKDPDRYGKGAVEGILVPESANNASVGGSLVPLLSLGIPGSAAAAVLAGGLMAQGLTPGPQLMEKNPEIAYAFIVSMIIANIGMLLIGYLLVRVCTRILDVPKLLIIPAVISISFLGAYALRNSMFDVLLMILSGGIAYLLLKAKIMPAGIALGLVLGRIIEENLIVTLYRTQAEDSLADLLVFSPLAAVFMAACILAIVIPLWLNHRKQARASPSLACARPERACAATTLGRPCDHRRRGCPPAPILRHRRHFPSFPGGRVRLHRRPGDLHHADADLFRHGAEAGNRASGLLLEHLPVPRAHGRRLSAHRTARLLRRHVPLHRRHDRLRHVLALRAQGRLAGHRFGTGLFAAPHRRRVRLFLADHGSTDPYGASVLTLRPKDISYGHNGIENTA